VKRLARQNSPVSLVITFRPGDVPPGSLLPRLAAGTTGLRIALGALDVAATAGLVSWMLAGEYPSAEFAAFMHEYTGGVPPAVEESVRLLAARADLTRRGGQWVRPPAGRRSRQGTFPSMITTGPDEALWFTLNQAGAIGRIGLDGKVMLHRLPSTDAAPVGITCGADDAVWFAEIAAGQIGRLGADGTIQEFPLPDRAAKPHAITTAPSGKCWFTEWGANRIGCVTPAGVITEYDLPTPSSEPHGIAVGPDGAVWTALEIGATARLAA
jgi:hypothetical protein